MSATMTKVTSLGSQYSACGTPCAPHPTPATEPLAGHPFDPPPPMDFAAVARILGPIQETLNESAEAAMYPSPPINTPEVLSPAPSVVYRHPSTRGRGFSVIGDRLAQLKLDNRKQPHRDSDMASSSRSVEPSVAEDDECDAASTSEVLSDRVTEKQSLGVDSTSPLFPCAASLGHSSVPIATGPPTVNPRIEEYLSFTSNDLPTTAPAACTSSMPAKHTSSSNQTAVDNESLHSRISVKSDGGVTEKSNWAEEVEDSVDRACMRLEQLARDEFITDPSKSIEDYYIARLTSLLGNGKRVVPVTIQKKVEDMQDSAKHASGK